MATADNNNAGNLDAEALASDISRTSLEEAQGQATESDGAGTGAVALPEETGPEDGDILEKMIKNETDGEHVKSYISKVGINHTTTELLHKLNNWREQKLRIGVTGARGSGKSSLVNTLRGLKPKQEGAAEVGVTETTTEVQNYSHPELANYTLVDLPGMGTPNFPKTTYIEKVELHKFNCLIICSQKAFTENDLWLAEESHRIKIPFVFIRTHIDQDIENDSDDHGEGFVEDICLKRIRDEIQTNLSCKHIPHEAVFLISTKLKHIRKYEYANFLTYIKGNLPKRVCDAFTTTMAILTIDVINAKKEMLQKRIHTVALFSAINNCSGFGDQQILEKEYTFYKQQMDVPEAKLQVPKDERNNLPGALGAALLGTMKMTKGKPDALAIAGVVGVVGCAIYNKYKQYKSDLNERLNLEVDAAARALGLIKVMTKKA